jgi:hypothetical protein
MSYLFAHLRALLVGVAVFAITGSAAAQDFATCIDRADAAADQWSDGQIAPLSDANTADPGNYVVILYGKKYQRPYSRSGSVNIIRHFDGDLVSIRNKVYDDEYDRCMGYHEHRIRFIVSGQ